MFCAAGWVRIIITVRALLYLYKVDSVSLGSFRLLINTRVELSTRGRGGLPEKTRTGAKRLSRNLVIKDPTLWQWTKFNSITLLICKCTQHIGSYF